MSEIVMEPLTIKAKVRAIIMFGPATASSGFRPGEYFQAVIDPNMKSPKGDFIRFDQRFQGGDLHGWQRVDALTVCEVLVEVDKYESVPAGYVEEKGASLTMLAISHKKRRKA